MISATDTGLPVMTRGLPGSVRSLAEIDTSRTTLILDRGFVSEANEKVLREAKIAFVLPQRRNSTRYETRIHLTDHHFFYHKGLIHAGKREVDGVMLYRLLEEGMIDRETLNKRLKRAGRILIVSSPSGRTPGGLRPLQVQKPGRRT